MMRSSPRRILWWLGTALCTAGELFPNGDSSYDSGVVVDTPIAPGRAITVRATVAWRAINMTRLSNWLAFVAFVAGVLVGCGNMEALSPIAPDTGCFGDACIPGPPLGDAGLDVDVGTPPPAGREGLSAGGFVASASPEDLASCYDGEDNNGDGFFDCSDPGCASLPSCCVGATSLGCCGTPELVATMTLGGCIGSIDGCTGVTGFVGFGTPSSTTGADRLFPNGDALDDSGIVLTTPLDGQRALVVRGLLSTPVGDCGDGCFESVALGLIPAGTTPGSATTLRPLVAVVASAARRELALVLTGETVGRVTLSSAREQQVTLVVLPTGVVSLEVYDAETREVLPPLGGRIVPGAVDLRLAVYGHNLNRSAPALPASYARDVSVSSALCDVPSRWLGREAVSIGTGAGTFGSSSAPSFTYGGGNTFVAFASDGELAFGRADGEDLSGGFALLATNRRFAIAGEVLSDPDVHYDAPVDATPASYTVYFANLTHGSIWRLRLGLDGAPLDVPTLWLSPALDAEFIESIDGPSVLRPAPFTSGPTYVFARVRTTTHETRIVRFVLATEDTPFVAPTDWGSVTVRTTQADFGAFDRDEVAAPAAYRQNGSLQVAFAGRSGARWALGLVATDDPRLMLWRRAPSPTIFTGDGVGFDALSVRDPAIVASGTKVELLYAGSDGVTDTLGYAQRFATDGLVGGP